MIQELPVSEKNIFAFRVNGRLTDDDYQQFLPRIDELVKAHGRISLLIELDNFRGWELKAAWDDLKYGVEHEDDFERIAIVGEKRWHGWFVKLASAMSSTDIRYFDHDDLQAAWAWLREGDSEPAGEPTTETQPEPIIEPYRHILVAIDFSRFSQAALKRAMELGRHYDAELSLIHAIEPIIFATGDTDGVVIPYDYVEQERQIFDAAKKRLDKLADSLDYPNMSSKVIWGTPKNAILSYAEAQNVDLIVAGSHGHRGLARLMGSTTSALVHSARCDVTVVRIRGEQQD